MDIAQKQTFEKWAGIAYAVGFVILILFGYYMHTGYFKYGSDETPTPIQLAFITAFMFGHAYFVWKGKTWAKVLMAVFLVVILVDSIMAAIIPGVQGETSFSIAHNLIRGGLCAIEVTLLMLSFRRTIKRVRAK